MNKMNNNNLYNEHFGHHLYIYIHILLNIVIIFLSYYYLAANFCKCEINCWEFNEIERKLQCVIIRFSFKRSFLQIQSNIRNILSK